MVVQGVTEAERAMSVDRGAWVIRDAKMGELERRITELESQVNSLFIVTDRPPPAPPVPSGDYDRGWRDGYQFALKQRGYGDGLSEEGR